LTSAPAGSGELVRIRSLPSLGANTRNDAVREAEVEAEFLWPAVRGRNVEPFDVSDSGQYVIAPYDTAMSDKPLSVDELMSRAPHLYDYLEPWIERLSNRSAYQLSIDGDHPWPILGPWAHLRRGSHLVMTRYMHPNKTPPAAVRLARFDQRLGMTTTAYPNNKVNFIAADSESEAHYIAAWINAPACQEAIARFVSSTTIPPAALERLPIPKFDAGDPLHAELARLGSECYQVARQGEDYSPLVGQIGVFRHECGEFP